MMMQPAQNGQMVLVPVIPMNEGPNMIVQMQQPLLDDQPQPILISKSEKNSVHEPNGSIKD
jgi:hypothetical protein